MSKRKTRNGQNNELIRNPPKMQKPSERLSNAFRQMPNFATPYMEQRLGRSLGAVGPPGTNLANAARTRPYAKPSIHYRYLTSNKLASAAGIQDQTERIKYLLSDSYYGMTGTTNYQKEGMDKAIAKGIEEHKNDINIFDAAASEYHRLTHIPTGPGPMGQNMGGRRRTHRKRRTHRRKN